jgi:hypothetical protein
MLVLKPKWASNSTVRFAISHNGAYVKNAKKAPGLNLTPNSLVLLSISVSLNLVIVPTKYALALFIKTAPLSV